MISVDYIKDMIIVCEYEDEGEDDEWEDEDDEEWEDED